MRQPTTDELLAALARIRALPRCAAWPAELPAVLADPVRGRLLRIEAIRTRRQPAQRARQATRRRAGPHPLATALLLFDRKRAAAGDRED